MEILNRLEDKIDRLSQSVAELKTSLAVQQCSHTNTVERVKTLETEMAPVKRQSFLALGAWKLVVSIGVVIGIGAGAAQVVAALTGVIR